MEPVVLRPGVGDNRPTATLYYGQDTRETLRTLPEASIHTVCTSPPYFGLRDYGADGQIGLEPTPEEFVAALVEVFREVKRVLRPDGTLWLNLGDSYTSGGRTGHGTRVGFKQQTNCGMNGTRDPVRPPQPPNIKSKDLIGIPWRVAFALQADGWYLRQDIVWAKPNPMPESVTDRCTKAHEYIFLLSKSERYFFDSEAMKEPCSEDMQRRAAKGHTRGQGKIDTSRNDAATVRPTVIVADTRNRRSVWTVTTQPYSGAHFATWPPELVRPMVLAGCPVGGTVLDPFSGSATTGMVALQEGRNYIGTDINPDYLPLAERRVREEPAPVDTGTQDDGDALDLFAHG